MSENAEACQKQSLELPLRVRACTRAVAATEGHPARQKCQRDSSTERITSASLASRQRTSADKICAQHHIHNVVRYSGTLHKRDHASHGSKHKHLRGRGQIIVGLSKQCLISVALVASYQGTSDHSRIITP